MQELRKLLPRKYETPEFNISNPASLTHDAEGNDIEVGDNVVALCKQYYFMGQCKDDNIGKNEICVVEQISYNGRLFLEEHASRYGPWLSEDFIRLDKWKEYTGSSMSVLFKKNKINYEEIKNEKI